MAHRSDTELLVLHALRTKGFADTEVVAAAVDVEVGEAQRLLDGFADKGWARYRDGRVTGWLLAPEGRAEGEQRLAAELDDAGVRSDIDDGYQRFLGINQGMLGVCTAWQVRQVDGEEVPNDHSDGDYDAGVIERLAEIDAAVQPICTDLGARLLRFDAYGARLGNALDKVRSGEVDWFTSPRVESYHTVWFELHEDLLATLGIERSKEGER